MLSDGKLWPVNSAPKGANTPIKTFKKNGVWRTATKTDDLLKAATFIKNAGYIVDAVIIVKDIADVANGVHGAKGALVIDAGGAILGYINPATGIFITMYSLVSSTTEFNDIMYLDMLEKRRKRYDELTKDCDYCGDLFLYDYWYEFYTKKANEYYQKSSYRVRDLSRPYAPTVIGPSD